ncbi:helix-turn-helix domain-containing protein [Yoonia sp. I 8.24]|uniref:helix-turn-helix domain-containing protein n=1 Tax=Yoonia sp. I 8.24 TaxID=1537229 RepID=UPI001EE00115|nr:helix-turn-helix transcriptional regulator [Yoonia sp. I 8.24]MCG3267599.1 helix-turn-helix transcriptional regulator [Yoonia sp. I 8.24]
MSDDARAFGQVVRQRRNTLNWSGEKLAAEAFGNPERKGMISLIENGKIPNLTRDTVRKVAQALSLEVENIPASLRWVEAVEVGEDTNSMVREIHADTEKLVEIFSSQAQKFKIKEGMLIALAKKYAKGSPHDFDDAYEGLGRALEVAAKDRENGKLLTNLDDAVNAIITRIDALNDAGNLETAAALLVEEEARAKTGLINLYYKGINQAIIMRNVSVAADYQMKILSLKAPEPDDTYHHLNCTYMGWSMRALRSGSNFDIEVSNALMRRMMDRFSYDRRIKGRCLDYLGDGLRRLAYRENNLQRLEEALVVFRFALSETDRDVDVLLWSSRQMSLNFTLYELGEREKGIEGLEEVAAAFCEALEKRTLGEQRIMWTQQHKQLGLSLWELGEKSGGLKRLKEVIAAFNIFLEGELVDTKPVNRAIMQCQQAVAMFELAERTDDSAAAIRALGQLRSGADTIREHGKEAIANRLEGMIPDAHTLLSHLQKDRQY